MHGRMRGMPARIMLQATAPTEDVLQGSQDGACGHRDEALRLPPRVAAGSITSDPP
jgi:hypothetical protein